VDVKEIEATSNEVSDDLNKTMSMLLTRNGMTQWKQKSEGMVEHPRTAVGPVTEIRLELPLDKTNALAHAMHATICSESGNRKQAALELQKAVDLADHSEQKNRFSGFL